MDIFDFTLARAIMALDETQLERLVISLEANTSRLDTQLVKSSALLDKQLSAMEARTQTWSQRIEKSLGGSATTAGRLFSATMSEGERTAARFAGNLGPLGGILEGVGAGGLLAAGGIGAFGYLLEQGTAKLAVHERQLATIEGVLRATASASGQTGTSIEAMAERISAATLQTRSGVLQAATELLAFRNVGQDVFEPTLKLAADMAQVFGTDMADSAKRLGLAMDDPVQGMNLLRRAGVDLSTSQKEIIRNFEQTGDLASAQKALLQALEERIGGAGAAAHTGLSGATNDLSEAWDKLLIALARGGPGALAVRAINLVSGAVEGLDRAIHAAGPSLKMLAAVATGDYAAVLSGAFPGSSGGQTPGQDYRKGPPVTAASVQSFFGPSLEADQAARDFVKALKDTVDELKKSPLQQAIDKHIKEAAEKQNLTTDAYLKKFPEQAAQVAQLAAEEYNLAQARKDAKKAAEEAKKAEEERQRAWAESLKKSIDAFKLVDELTNKLSGASGKPGAERSAYIAEQLARLPEGTAGAFGSDVSSAAGAAFDAKALEEQIQKGREVVRTYHDQQNALQADAAAAAAAKYEQDALVELYQKTGEVSEEAARKIHEQAIAIADAGHAAKAAEEEYHRSVELLDNVRSGLENVGAAGIHGFHGMRDAAKQFIEQLAELIIKLYIMQPLLEQLLGPQGTAGGGLLGSLFSSGAPAASGAASSGGIFSSIASIFGFASGGRVRGYGGSQSDRVPARLTAGEFVVDADATARNLPLLYAISSGAIPGFASGGYVSSPRVASAAASASRGGFGGITVHVDARGATEGVAEQIDAKLRDVLPGFGTALMAHYDKTLPAKINKSFQANF